MQIDSVPSVNCLSYFVLVYRVSSEFLSLEMRCLGHTIHIVRYFYKFIKLAGANNPNLCGHF